MSAEFDCREHEGVSYVRLSGVVDGTFNAKAFVEVINSPRVILNLSKLERIDDGGRRVWRRLLEHLSDTAEEVLLWDCPSDVTEQFSETPALIAQAKLASYQVPYRCTSCRKDIAVRLDAATLNPDDVSGALCRGCDGKLRVQRNPEVLVDLRKHSAFENAALRMKNLVVSMERRFGDSDFLEVHTASDLPDAFESTTNVLPAGSGETKIEELTPIQSEQTRPDPSDAAPSPLESSEPTRPEPPRESRPDRTVPDRENGPPERASQKQMRIEPRLAGNANFGAGAARRSLAGDDVALAMETDYAAERKLRLHPRPRRTEVVPIVPIAAVGLAGLVIGFVIGFLSTEGGLPETPILKFTVSLNDGDFTKAEAVLEASKGELPDILVELYRQELARARADAADVYRRQAVQSFKEQRYDEAASYAREAIVIEDPEGKMLYLLADSLRLAGKKNDALPHYRAFFEKFPEDELADDAMFWRAEALARLGQYDEAKDLLERILALTRSNHKRQAGKLLLDLP